VPGLAHGAGVTDRVESLSFTAWSPYASIGRDELENRAVRLEELDIAHGHIKDARYGSGFVFRDPDGIALEF